MSDKKKPEKHIEKSFEEIVEEVEQEDQLREALSEEVNDEALPITSALDHEILMHRDVHFGGQFEVMLDYYQKGGKGIQPEFDIPLIQSLYDIERTSKQNLSPLILSGPEMEKIGKAKEAYKKLRALYELKNPKPHPILIADLILSEENPPQKEMEAIAQEKASIVPLLIDILRSEELYDPLFPGYGLPPTFAAQCLGMIGDKRAIIALFEALDQGDFFSEEAILKALKEVGQPAKEFLLKVLKGRPLNQDNEKAALALIQFREDPTIAKACFELLQDKEVRKHIPLGNYLILACEGLTDESSRKFFNNLENDPSIPSLWRTDIKTIAKLWKDDSKK